MDTGNLHPAQSTQRRWLWLIVGCVALVPLLIVVIVVADRTSPLNRVPAAAPTPSASPTADPWRAALATLHAQAAALVRRDEQGWLAAVDPAAPHTRALFQQRFAALAALDVSQFSYQSGIPPVLILGATRFVADIYSTYCFSLDSCPAFSLGTGTGAPKIWAIGYIIGLNDVESDVVLKMTRIRGATELANTLQHELGHVVTLGGHRHRRQGDLQPGLMAGREHRRVHRLLGPARHRQCPPSRRAHHRAQRRPPPSIVLGELDDSTSSRASNAYYGLSHFGVDCLALASAKCGLRHPQTAPRQHLRPGVQEGLRRPVPPHRYRLRGLDQTACVTLGFRWPPRAACAPGAEPNIVDSTASTTKEPFRPWRKGMRKVVSGLFISLDGVVESPNQWQFEFDEDMGAALTTTLETSDAVLLGRVTYTEWAGYWPTVTSGDDAGFATWINTSPKYVASTTLDNVDDWPNSTLITGDLAAAVHRLKAGQGKAIAVAGSPGLVRSLLDQNLLDELVLLIHPVIAGEGRAKLFADDTALKKLHLVSVQPTRSGVIIATYRPVT